MKYKIVESVNKKENINHPVDDNFTLSEELLNIKTEKINESVDNKPINEDWDGDLVAWNEQFMLTKTGDNEYSVYNKAGSKAEFVAKITANTDEEAKNICTEFIYETPWRGAFRDGTLPEYVNDYLAGSMNESLEEDFEYSDYDKKLLVNRAKSIAKAISDLYNSNQVEAQGELPSENEIAKALLESPQKIDMYAKFLSKIKGTKKAESMVEKLVKELMSFKKKLSMVKKPQPATESMNEAVEELTDEEKKEIIDSLEDMIESGETGCECYDEPTKKLVIAELKKRGFSYEPSGNGDHTHIEWYKKKGKNESIIPAYATGGYRSTKEKNAHRDFFMPEPKDMSDEELKEYLEELIKEVNKKRAELKNESLLVEKAVPEEDRYENNLIKSIINKRSNRSNAKLTSSEQEVANKYGITTGRYHSGIKTRVGNRNIRYVPNGKGYDDINYVDMARKGTDRMSKAYETGINVVNRFSGNGLGGSREEKKSDDLNTRNALVQSRNRLNRVMQNDYSEVASKAGAKKYYKNVLDNVDNEFDKKRDDYIARINALTRELADNEKNREEKRTYNKNVINNITNDQKAIINKHRKNKSESFHDVSYDEKKRN